MAPRHAWKATESQHQDQEVQRCAHCETERTRDTSTKALYLYRRGRAIQRSKKPLGEVWEAFIAGVVPKCPGKVAPSRE